MKSKLRGSAGACACLLHARTLRLALLGSAAIAAWPAPSAAAEGWEPFPTYPTLNDFGGVGLIQTPTARFSEDGQFYFGANRVYPYERYFVTAQATPWLEATLRYTSVDNRLFSPFPEFSGDQSFKDRGLDVKVEMIREGRLLPALAFGARDFLGTGLFSSEYFVASKEIGPFDASLGIGWGNMGSRDHFRNPFTLISSRFRRRGGFEGLGGSLGNDYFKGPVALFGGVSYETPIRGLTAKVEYDPNDYKAEALGNAFKVDSPINVGLDYRVRSWLHVGASFERGNKVGLKLVLTTNFDRRTKAPKIDAPPPQLGQIAEAPADQPSAISIEPAAAAREPLGATTVKPETAIADGTGTRVSTAPDVNIDILAQALARQGSALFAADFAPASATLYVAQTRFRNMATGLGRISRAAFSALPERFAAVTIVLVEGGVETMSATMYRSALEKALTPGRGSTDELFVRTEFDSAPLALGDSDYVAKTRPGFYYAIRPGLRTTLGRPEQFILYQAWLRFNASLELGRGLSAIGSIGVNISDNFDKLRIPSDSKLPRVRSDIKEYLRQGRTSIPYLHADYTFNIAPSLYGHVYGGLLEEMFGGVGGEVMYRPYDANWAIGVDVNYARQRDFDQWFSFRNYDVVTGHVTGAYHFETLDLDAVVKAGRYLAKDWGATFQLSRTFESGITIGAFATKTDVSAAQFGEGSFDKGMFLTIPLDILYVRNVRSGIGILWRPLIRDGGQMLNIRRPLLATTGAANMYTLRRDWRDILD